MLGDNINIGGSVMKRESKSVEAVRRQLSRDGWSQTASRGNRISYHEKSGINLTVIKGLGGTLIIPSGPVRGSVFGKNVALLNRESVLGAGSSQKERNQRPTRSNRDKNSVIN